MLKFRCFLGFLGVNGFFMFLFVDFVQESIISPIEDVWKDIKREIYNADYNSLDELTELFE